MSGDEGLEAYHWVGVELRLGGVDGADGEVVDGEILRGGELCGVVSGVPEEGVGADDGAGFCGWQVGLTDVKAEAEEGGVVGAVIENEISFAFSAGFEGLDEVPCELAFMANLDPVGTTVYRGLKAVCETVAVEVGGIEDWVEHYSWMGAWLSESAQAEIFSRRQTQHRPSVEFGATSLPQTVHLVVGGSSTRTGFFFVFSLSAKLRF
jgi:hypothetical protein